MSKDLYFNNDNIPPGEEDPGLQLPSKSNVIPRKKWEEEKKWKNEMWEQFPDIKEHYE